MISYTFAGPLKMYNIQLILQIPHGSMVVHILQQKLCNFLESDKSFCEMVHTKFKETLVKYILIRESIFLYFTIVYKYNSDCQ